MPIGILTDAIAVAGGGLLGGLLKNRISKQMAGTLNLIFGFCAICIGINGVIKLDSMSTVMVSVILGTVIGELCHIESGIGSLIRKVLRKVTGSQGSQDLSLMCTAMAVFCFSGTGIYGALSEGLDGDSSILLAKAVLDFFTAMIFATEIGYFTAAYAIPQAVILLICFGLAQVIRPFLTAAAIANFKAAGGMITMMIGFNMIAGQNGWKKVNVLNTIPALILVVLLSWIL